MAEAGAHAAAYDATVVVEENPPITAAELRRLQCDVDMCRRVLAEIEDAPDRVEQKYAKLELLLAGKAEELAEAESMVDAARRALADAETALAGTEG